MSKETHTLVVHGVPVIHAIEYVFKAIMIGGFRVDECHSLNDSSFLGMPARPRPTIKVAISRPEPAKEPDFNPGDKVYLADGRECLYISPHPEHPVHVLETPDNEFIALTSEDFYKEPVKPTPINIPWPYIDDKWKYAAMDDEGDIWFFNGVPSLNEHKGRWDYDEDCECVEQVFHISTEEINWKTSLTARPSMFDYPLGPIFNCRCSIKEITC